MEGNAISAAFTALWRGLDGDELSARVAVDLLKTDQVEVMRRARFAPALRALVGAREKAVNQCLRSACYGAQPADYTVLENADDELFAQCLRGESDTSGGKEGRMDWDLRWELIDKQMQNKVSCIEDSSSAVHLPAEAVKKSKVVVVSLGAGLDMRCQHSCLNIEGEEAVAWLRVDRECVQVHARSYCQVLGCQKCSFINGDVAAKSTCKKILHYLKNYEPHRVVWLAEGLVEYLKPRLQKKMLELISNVQGQLPGVEGELVVALLGKSINKPMKLHYGAQFGWKFTSINEVEVLLTEELGWNCVPRTSAVKAPGDTTDDRTSCATKQHPWGFLVHMQYSS